MFSSTDPRRALTTSVDANPPPNPATDDIAAPEFYDFSQMEPDVTSGSGARTWIVRGQNVVIIYTQPVVGEALKQDHPNSECVVILAEDDSAAEIVTADEKCTVSGRGLVVMPPGSSAILPTGPGDLVRLVQPGTDLGAQAHNAASYATPHPRVSGLELWPEPVGGSRLLDYPLSKVPTDSSRFGRIFRTRAFMVNFLEDCVGPRDPRQMSPHHHDDFEQLSLAVAGEFSHHIRTPWTTDMTAWRADEHCQVGSPSLAVIPPPTVHTTRATGTGTNRLIDIFAPPRADFSAQPGWVLNADEYPAP